MKVSINLRIRTADGKQPYCPLVREGKRIKKLKPGWCVVNGAEEFHRAAERAGLNKENFWLHKFRDTFGTWTCRAGKVDLRTLQHWMRHTSITMTERYLAPGQGAYAQTGINATFGGITFGNDKVLTTASSAVQ